MKIPVEVRRMGNGDEGVVGLASGLFDGPPDMAGTADFLANPDCIILFVYVDGEAAAMGVSERRRWG